MKLKNINDKINKTLTKIVLHAKISLDRVVMNSRTSSMAFDFENLNYKSLQRRKGAVLTKITIALRRGISFEDF